MLNIILHNNIHEALNINKNIVVLNDAFFNLYISNVQIDKGIVSIIKRIDKVEYAGQYRVRSKFQNDVNIRIEELSTGCKTAINTWAFPDKIFYADECGENALQTICNFKHGSIIVTEMFVPLKFNNSIQVISKEHKVIIHNNIELENEMINFFDGR